MVNDRAVRQVPRLSPGRCALAAISQTPFRINSEYDRLFANILIPYTMSPNPQTVASTWLSNCKSALQKADVNAFANLFLPDGWLRDLLVFTWDIRSLAGREKISSYLAKTLS